MVSDIFYFQPYLGKWSNLTVRIFFKWVSSTTNPGASWRRCKPCVKNVVMLVQAHPTETNPCQKCGISQMVGGKLTPNFSEFEGIMCRFLSRGRDGFWFRIRRLYSSFVKGSTQICVLARDVEFSKTISLLSYQLDPFCRFSIFNVYTWYLNHLYKPWCNICIIIM